MKDVRDETQEKPEDADAPLLFAGRIKHKNARGRLAEDGDIQIPPLWLITVTDVMALMLTFFVLLYSMSTPEVEKWEDFTSAINEGFSKFYSQPWDAGAQDTINIDKIDMRDALNLNYLNGLVENIIAKDERLKDSVVILQKDRLILSLPQDLLFEAGQASVQPRAQQALFSVADLLVRIRNRVEIIGHTDPRPIENPETQADSNWELSLTRAIAVSGVLRASGYDRDMVVRGLASARYVELPGTIPEEERLGYARRVDIVIMTDDGAFRPMLMMGGGG